MQNMEFRTCKIAVPDIRSLCWVGDTLVDWVAGGTVIRLDGSIEASHVSYAYRFDAAIASPCGDYAVIYERLGTTGLVLHKGEILRQIQRDFYHADDYEYPIAIFRSRTGRTVLAHCPQAYCQLELEDIETGERLGGTSARDPGDFFHSRLRVSPDGRWLASAGWVWHPLDTLAVFDLEAALQDAPTLDKPIDFEGFNPYDRETVAADFLPDGRLLVVLGPGWDDSTEAAIESDALAILDPVRRALTASVETVAPTGTLMPLDARSTVAFCVHPKVLSLLDGSTLAAWEQIDSGRQGSSITGQEYLPPPIAMDHARARFAVAGADGVTVIERLTPTSPPQDSVDATAHGGPDHSTLTC